MQSFLICTDFYIKLKKALPSSPMQYFPNTVPGINSELGSPTSVSPRWAFPVASTMAPPLCRLPPGPLSPAAPSLLPALQYPIPLNTCPQTNCTMDLSIIPPMETELMLPICFSISLHSIITLKCSVFKGLTCFSSFYCFLPHFPPHIHTPKHPRLNTIILISCVGAGTADSKGFKCVEEQRKLGSIGYVNF